uniref:Sulfur oxidation protein DsrJ n=1 Tax=uncultured bacterium ws034A6 TaxID=1131824 RepID=I1X566_9BACT|nr:sulfur oxidation protein DsrJ [uncultured bacterium ws034A6]
MRYTRFIVLALGMLSGIVAPVMADDLLPFIPEAQDRFSDAQGCVEPTGEMRKNHMEYILHQRDETVHEGIRDKQHSLVECINCHVSDAPDAPRVSSEEHFCNSCHSYAAVSIDCFQCHADRPVKTGSELHSLSQHIKSNAGSAKLTPENLQAFASGVKP